jgi:HEAT repeat protein
MDEEIAPLLDILHTSRRPALRLEAIRQLAEMQAGEAVPALLDVLEEAGDPRSVAVVTAAVAAIQHLGVVAAPYVVAALEDEYGKRRPFLPLLLVSSLGDQALPLLLDALADPDVEVAVNAATQLGLLRLADAFEPLLALVRNSSAPDALRGAAAAALGALRDRRSLPILVDLLSSPEHEILAGAIDGLADLRDPAGAEYLEDLLERQDLDESTERAIRLGLLAMERYRLR